MSLREIFRTGGCADKPERFVACGFLQSLASTGTNHTIEAEMLMEDVIEITRDTSRGTQMQIHNRGTDRCTANDGRVQPRSCVPPSRGVRDQHVIPAPRERVLSGRRVRGHLELIDHLKPEFAADARAVAIVPARGEHEAGRAARRLLAGLEVRDRVRLAHARARVVARARAARRRRRRGARAVGVLALCDLGEAGEALLAVVGRGVAALHARVYADLRAALCDASATSVHVPSLRSPVVGASSTIVLSERFSAAALEPQPVPMSQLLQNQRWQPSACARVQPRWARHASRALQARHVARVRRLGARATSGSGSCATVDEEGVTERTRSFGTG
eukprot:6458120-Prymnesium_polylepis.2